MSIRDRTVPEFEQQDSVVHLVQENTGRNNNFERSPPKRVLFRRRIPSEILDDLPESSVDPLPGEFEDGGGVADTRLSSVLGRDAPDLSCGRAITVTGSPVRPPVLRSHSVDYSRRRVFQSKWYFLQNYQIFFFN